MIEREAPGGQAGMSSRIENYLGFPSGLTGADLARRAVVQARRFGVEIISAEATAVRIDGPYRFLQLANGAELSCHALLVATGVQWRKLDAPGVERLTGAGIYYGAAMTEAMSTRDEDVYVVGGANSAGQAAMHFSRYARRVVMLVRGSSLATSMSQYLINQLKATPNIHIEYNTRVVEAHGEDRLEAISIYCMETNEINKVPANSLFLMIGAAPNTEWLANIVERDERGNAIYRLSEGCVLVNFMFIGCSLGKPKIHDDMFDNMRLYFDEQRLPRTNEGNGTEPESRPAD